MQEKVLPILLLFGSVQVHTTAVKFCGHKLHPMIAVEASINAHNQSCEFPSDFGTLQHLQILNVYGSGLRGTLPPVLMGMTQLSALLVDKTSMSGTIPRTIYQLSNLELLQLSSNEMSGELPTELFSLTKLTLLGLQNNQFSGPIPHDIAKLTSLLGLTLQNNRLTRIPPLAQLTILLELNVKHNKIKGHLPDLRSVRSLAVMNAAGNRQLCGAIDKSMTSSRTLIHIEGTMVSCATGGCGGLNLKCHDSAIPAWQQQGCSVDSETFAVTLDGGSRVIDVGRASWTVHFPVEVSKLDATVSGLAARVERIQPNTTGTFFRVSCDVNSSYPKGDLELDLKYYFPGEETRPPCEYTVTTNDTTLYRNTTSRPSSEHFLSQPLFYGLGVGVPALVALCLMLSLTDTPPAISQKDVQRFLVFCGVLSTASLPFLALTRSAITENVTLCCQIWPQLGIASTIGMCLGLVLQRRDIQECSSPDYAVGNKRRHRMFLVLAVISLLVIANGVGLWFLSKVKTEFDPSGHLTCGFSTIMKTVVFVEALVFVLVSVVGLCSFTVDGQSKKFGEFERVNTRSLYFLVGVTICCMLPRVVLTDVEIWFKFTFAQLLLVAVIPMNSMLQRLVEKIFPKNGLNEPMIGSNEEESHTVQDP